MQSTVALFKMPSSLTFNSQLNLDGPEESAEVESEKIMENIYVEPTQVSSAPLKTVIRLPKIGSKKKGKRRFAEEDIDNAEDPNTLPLQEKRKKSKTSQLGQVEQNISSNTMSLSVEEREYIHESPSLRQQRPRALTSPSVSS